MFGLGTTELIIILVILVMVFGLGKLPNAAGQIGNAVNSFRDAMQGKGDEIEIGDEDNGGETPQIEDQKSEETVNEASVPHQQESKERPADGGTW